MIKHVSFLTITALILISCTYNIQNSKLDAKTESASKEPSPVATNIDISIENAELLDHRAQVLGVLCSAHNYDVKLADDLTTELQRLDKNGTLEPPSGSGVRVTVASASSHLKCLMTGVVSAKCQAKVDISGSLSTVNGDSESFTISKSALDPVSALAGGPGGGSMAACDDAAAALQTASADAVSELSDKIKSLDK
ncbi:MAG: hypothetical protein NXI13_11880 [Proteobacteria bacterium]|nr:hypothetical protein [Pseudomonadota bacterium]